MCNVVVRKIAENLVYDLAELSAAFLDCQNMIFMIHIIIYMIMYVVYNNMYVALCNSQWLQHAIVAT